ncbi:uracil-DNA glycosylase [Thorsellia anophelis]|uniref:Uracil-DNA glycosylase n=1 Tax=Thorsellia anophelis DSM 18579 TaxID=1123402 RepID=A0A1I0CBB5_9GAMM|nr:uracil-DNA glycosylase [Thorsellia anophelis]SET16400.1 Uracil-DNA glycosylase [Thorsellia anophelis DSM 18579]
MSLNWKTLLADEEKKSYFQNILQSISTDRQAGKTIYPEEQNIFKALELTPFNQVQVVILGQDPYHGPNQAHGLAFSVKPSVTIPPSLRNIFKSIAHDYPDFQIPESGYLGGLAKQGVLLLNTTLTVEAGKANSHAHLGWERYTDKIIELINYHKQNVIFLLWGNYAIKKSSLIDETKHVILTSVHPSPLSAHRGFLTCGHFRKTNEILSNLGRHEIQWQETNK